MKDKITLGLKLTGYAIWFVGLFFFVGFVAQSNSILLAIGIGFIAFAFGMVFIGLVELINKLDALEKLVLTPKPVEVLEEPESFDKTVS